MAGACDGLRIIDLSRGMAGSLATMLLADNGAEVISIEKPGADRVSTEAGYRLWNRGKRSIYLDLKQPAQYEKFLKLCSTSAAIVIALRRSTIKQLDIGYEKLVGANPRLIYTTITPFGLNSQVPEEHGYEALVAARSGFMGIQSGFREGPIYMAPPLGSFGASFLSLHGILAALHAQEKGYMSQHVDISLVASYFIQRSYILIEAAKFQDDLASRSYIYSQRDPLGTTPMCTLNQCADGRWVNLACPTRVFTERALEAMESSDLLEDPRFKSAPRMFLRDEDAVAFIKAVRERVSRFTSEELLRRFNEHDVPAEPVLTTEEFVDHPQIIANNVRINIDDSVLGPMIQPGKLISFSLTPPPEIKAAPLTGQDAERVLAELASTSIRSMSQPDSRGQTPPGRRTGPLSGMRVVDLTEYYAGPISTMFLADMGAEVIKVETLTGDGYRAARDTFAFANRGKKSIAINLKSSEGMRILEKLVRKADFFSHNFRPGVAERLHITYDEIRQLNPKIIYVWFTGFGSKGPQSQRPSYDYSLVPLSGVYLQQGGEGNPPASYIAADINGTFAIVAGMLMALRVRDKLGVGQMLDTSSIAAMAHFTGDAFVQYKGKPPFPRVDKGQHGTGALYRLYRTRDGWLFLACVREKHWKALRRVLKAPRLDAFDTMESVGNNREGLSEMLSAMFLTKDTAEWEELLKANDIPCSPVMDSPRDFFASLPGKKNPWLVWLKHSLLTKICEPGPALWLSHTPLKARRAEPLLGEHTDAILRSLGYSPASIQELRERKLIG